MEMPLVQETQVGTGTWNSDAPLSSFSVATYRRKDGTIVQMPVQVAGIEITGSLQGPSCASA